MAENDVLLEIKDVAQTLGGNLILNNLDLTVRDRVRPGQVTGQLVGLLGPSGVGKTRLLRLIAGLDQPDRGTIVGIINAPVGMGASLGALAMLHAQRRFARMFAGLFLQSGSFFMPRYDSQESGFSRYARITVSVSVSAAMQISASACAQLARS